MRSGSFDRGPFSFDAGVGLVRIETPRTSWQVLPYAQPQPYFTVVNGDTTETFTTDGALLLGDIVQGLMEPVVIHAGYNLLAGLLIARTGLKAADVQDMRVSEAVSGRLIMTLDRERFWLPAGSAIVFSPTQIYNSTCDVLDIATLESLS